MVEAEFWLQRWREGSTPWHEGAPNEALRRHLDCLLLEPGDRIFVPLCGKAEDMWWLHERGLEVLGIDLSPIAGREFLSAHRQDFTEVPGFPLLGAREPGVSAACRRLLRARS